MADTFQCKYGCSSVGRALVSKTRCREFVKESWEELKNNVTWLNREQASNLMIIVAVFSILFALATWGVDTAFSKLIALYFEKVIG